MTRREKIAFSVIVFTFAIGFMFYPQMPRWMVVHWNLQGNPDGYTDKFWGLFTIPIMLAIVYVIVRYVPGYDEHPFLKKVRPYYDDFLLILTIILAGVYISTISWNLGSRLMIRSVVAICLGVAYYYLARVIGKTKQNYLLGIRTPWTISNKNVWEQTHRRAAAVFNVVALLSFAGAFIPSLALHLSILPMVAVSIYLCWYSYRIYTRIGHKH